MKSFGYCTSKLDGTEEVITKVTSSFPERYQLPSSILRGVQDQGSNPICVSVALTDMVHWKCNSRRIQYKQSNSYFYDNCSAKSSSGMSPKDAFEVLLKNPDDIGYQFHRYAMIGSIEVLKDSILVQGPVMIALQVKSMNNDFWNGSENYGGHAVLLTGWDQSGFTLRNSWGYSYGNGGYYNFPYSDFDKILECWTLIN